MGQLWVRVEGLLFILRQLLFLLFYFSDYIVSFAQPFRLCKLTNLITDIGPYCGGDIAQFGDNVANMASVTSYENMMCACVT